MEQYFEFKKWEKKYAEAEINKAFSSIITRLIIHQSELLEFLKPLHTKYVQAFNRGDNIKTQKYQERLIHYYDTWLNQASKVIHATLYHCSERINERLTFAYDANNYKIDYDNEFTTVEQLKSRFTWKLQEEQKGKDMKLSAYNGYELFCFYDKINLPQKRQPEVLLAPYPNKRPRLVHSYTK